jgi:prolyl-tRNA editing enzyme YbaK/EbsC (Cys-tRNA(Pro) deacylase)
MLPFSPSPVPLSLQERAGGEVSIAPFADFQAEVRAMTGCEIGTVNPLGLPQPLRLLADESIFQPAEVSIGSGLRATAIILPPSARRKALEIETPVFEFA